MTAPASTNASHISMQPLESRLHLAAGVFDDIVTTPAIGSPTLVKAGRFGYFDAAPGIHLQLTRTDGTPGGTSVIKGIPSGEYDGEMAVIGNDLFLLTRASESDTTTSTIWRIGPSTDVATLVHRFAPGVYITDVIAAGDAL